jgi:hypothetical protein
MSGGIYMSRYMKLNPYPVLLATGALMLATVVFAQVGAGASLLKAGVASRHPGAVETPATDEAHHPDTRVAAATSSVAQSVAE